MAPILPQEPGAIPSVIVLGGASEKRLSKQCGGEVGRARWERALGRGHDPRELLGGIVLSGSSQCTETPSFGATSGHPAAPSRAPGGWSPGRSRTASRGPCAGD